MRRASTITIIILLAILLALWSPWRGWQINLSDLFGVSTPAAVGSLQVSSFAGELVIYVDGSSQPAGRATPENSPVIIPGISPGDHQVQLTRTSNVKDAFAQFNRIINFASGVDVVIGFELGPTLDFSSGHMLYASSRTGGGDKAFLQITANVEGVNVSVDGTEIGTTPVTDHELSIDKQHKISLKKLGYETQEFLILPEQQAERDKLKGLNLNVEANLFLQPLLVHSGQ